MLAVIQVALAGARAALTVRSQDSIPSAPSVDAIEFPTPDMALTIQTGAERGNQVASAWSSGAELAFASMQVDWPTGTPPTTVTNVSPFGWIRLMYVAPVKDGPSDYAALSLMFERVSGKLTDARVSRWDVAPDQRALLDGITVSEETAVLAAEIDRGTVYRTACPDKRNESMVSITRDPATGEPIWNISYDENGRNSSGSMLIAVNASNGALSELREGPATCATNG
ncbi:MAG: hypothetical protein ACRDHN_03160 [Thermomicrobiales bacterium]